ncbi:MAG: hypothetical protein KDA93_18280 [Planctomycetaceae bacterium]|nr:hypothetical protein [Planctomycetaceae bacterium]
MPGLIPTRHSLAILICLVGAAPVSAQTVTVQHPVVQQFNVNTAVSVPDRGSTFLGGVSSARSHAVRRGFPASSSNFSRSVDYSGTRAHVYIHDLEVMDQAILTAARAQETTHTGSTLTGMAGHAQRSLLKRHDRQRTSLSGYAADASTVRRFGNRTLP